MQGKYAMARQSFEVGLKLKPDYASLQNNYGMMQLQSGDYEAAPRPSRGWWNRLTPMSAIAPIARWPRSRSAMSNAAMLDAPGMDETMLRRTLARYQPPKQEPIQSRPAGNIQMDVTPRARATMPTPAALEEALIAPTLIPEKLPPKVAEELLRPVADAAQLSRDQGATRPVGSGLPLIMPWSRGDIDPESERRTGHLLLQRVRDHDRAIAAGGSFVYFAMLLSPMPHSRLAREIVSLFDRGSEILQCSGFFFVQARVAA